MISVYVDTSALFALMDADDCFHPDAKKTWDDLLDHGHELVTTNYVLVEIYALLQQRLGLEAVRVFHHDLYPILHVIWVERDCHHEAMATLLALNRRKLSLVDCLSFIAMRSHHIDTVFTFDRHFMEQGFISLPISHASQVDLIHEKQD